MRFPSDRRSVLVALGFSFFVSLPAAAQETALPPTSGDATTRPAAVRPIGLAEALARAAQVSPRLDELVALEAAAAAAIDEARSSGRPSAELRTSYQRLSDVPEFAIAGADGQRRVIFPNLPNASSLRVEGSWPLWTGGRVPAAIAGAERASEAAGGRTAAGRADLMLEVASRYWSLAVARERERVVAAALVTFDAHLADARNRREVGIAAADEVLAVEVERDRARFAALEARQAAAIAGAALARLLDLPDTELAPTDRLGPPPPPAGELGPLVAAAVDARPEVAAARATLAAREARVALEAAARRPQLAARAGYDVANPNRRIVPQTDDWNDGWDVGLFLGWTLHDGGRAAAATRRAGAERDAARAAVADLERSIRLEVETRWREIAIAREAVGVAEHALAAARESLRITSDRYREGLVASSDRLDAENRLLQAELEVAQRLASARLAEAALRRAAGEAVVAGSMAERTED